ncbi:MAG: type IIA DNA topoisomerase subunit B, partial [Bacteroidales bacterium]|nr:type IIA DNA topoisomerase subunit B [Bacteroidales bacterium]
MSELLNTGLNYTEENVRTLEDIEHIRLRLSMYIGRRGDGSEPTDGIYVLTKEVVDNSIDEFSSGFGKKIDISLEGKTVSVRDYGRGVPLG